MALAKEQKQLEANILRICKKFENKINELFDYLERKIAEQKNDKGTI